MGIFEPFGCDNRGGRPRDFRPYRDPTLPREAPPTLDAPETPAALPSFITAAPRIPGPQDAGEPQPAPIVENGGEEAPAVETGAPDPTPSAEGQGPGRGRRRRLRSPYGFHPVAGQDEEGDDSPFAPDEAPISE